MDNRTVIQSTSRTSAKCSPVVLRETPTTRLVFSPMLVTNGNEPDAAVQGTFVYQRKGRKGAWQDPETISLSTLKDGEGYKLHLGSEEVLTLVREVESLYTLHAKHGIPRGVMELVPVDSAIARLAALSQEQLRALVPRLLAFEPDTLEQLNVAVGLGRLKQALSIWKRRARDASEEFWQGMLTKHPFVLEQVFAGPMVIVKGKAYVGGKSVSNTGGGLVDFLVKNSLTSNAALVEIKTPETKLLAAREYRDGVYNASEDLGGAVMQVLTYRSVLQTEFLSVTRASDVGPLEAFEPRCVVIVGTMTELDDADKVRSFELYRSHASGVTVITFDELFEKTQRLVTLLEATP